MLHLFVEIEPGIEGLVHTSRLPLGVDLSHESLEAGREVTGWVHEVEPKRRRVSLSLREVAKSNPWRGVADRFPEGEVVQGKVERLIQTSAIADPTTDAKVRDPNGVLQAWEPADLAAIVAKLAT